MSAADLMNMYRLWQAAIWRRGAPGPCLSFSCQQTDLIFWLSASSCSCSMNGSLHTHFQSILHNRPTSRRYKTHSDQGRLEEWCLLRCNSVRQVFLRSVRRLLVTASVVSSSPILVTLMKEALSSSETSDLTRATRRNISEDTVLHSHRRENLKSYKKDLFHNRRIKLFFTVNAVQVQFSYGGSWIHSDSTKPNRRIRSVGNFVLPPPQTAGPQTPNKITQHNTHIYDAHKNRAYKLRVRLRYAYLICNGRK
jgi:hypothetical protein